MIDADGEALIMDFGIARSTGGPSDVAAAPVLPRGLRVTGCHTEATVLGSVMGTVEYMAPEQARGLPVDERADIYTAGLILYDRLTGKRRAVGPNGAMDDLVERMDRGLPPLTSVAADVPAPLAEIVMRAIEPDPAKRFQRTAELAHALHRLDDKGLPLPVKRSSACGSHRRSRPCCWV